MLYEIIRLSTQHRALHCYVLLSLWIFLLVAGLYKFLEPTQKPKPFDLPRIESMQSYKTGLKTKRIFKSCNRLEDLLPHSEGTELRTITLNNYKYVKCLLLRYK